MNLVKYLYLLVIIVDFGPKLTRAKCKFAKVQMIDQLQLSAFSFKFDCKEIRLYFFFFFCLCVLIGTYLGQL